MRKIIIIGPAWPFRGGIASYNERLLEEFQKEPGDYKIYTFSKQYPNLLFPGKTQYSESEKPKHITIIQAINSINPINWLHTGRKLKKENADFIIIRYWMPFFAPAFGTFLRIARRNKKTKIICLVDNLIPHEKMPFGKLLTRYFVNSIDGFLVMSQTVLDETRQVSDKPVILSPHPIFDNFGDPVDPKFAQQELKLDPEFRYFLFFGLIRKYKGLDILLEAIGSQEVKSLPFKLIVAGEFYDDIATYQNLIKQYQLENKVILVNKFIKNEEIPLYFSASELIIQPYKTATQSGVTQICYHFDKPMIVSNVGGLPEIVPHEKCGYVTSPDAKGIAEAITKYWELNNPDYFSKGIEEQKKLYSWEQLIIGFEKLFKQI